MKPGEGVPNIVVATNRIPMLSKFIEEWKEELRGCHLIIVYDIDKVERLPCEEDFPFTYEIHDHKSIDKDLGKNSWVIPRGTSGIKSYGFLKALENKALFTVTLDDDVRPNEEGHIAKFYDTLFNVKRRPLMNWYSTLKYQTPRGTPEHYVPIGLVHGGWVGSLDLSAEDQLADDTYGGSFEHDFNQGIVPKGALFSMCGMNLAFKTIYTKYLYFGLQGRGHPVNRVDDIMAGMYAKKKLDADMIACWTGEPFVKHERASNPWKNRIIEKNVDEYLFNFEQIVDRGMTAAELKGHTSDEAIEYFEKLGKAYTVWERLCEERT